MRPTWMVAEGADGRLSTAWGPIVVATAPEFEPEMSAASAPQTAFALASGSCSLRGRRRINADWLAEQPPLYCVADGFGNGEIGNILSRVACQAAMRQSPAHCDLAQVLNQANSDVCAVQKLGGLRNCGTTLVVASVGTAGVEVAWAGDSAVLLVHADESIELLTAPLDRTRQGTLARALGIDAFRAHHRRSVLEAGDRIVLATDGAWEPLGADLPGILVCDKDPHAIAEALCQTAAKRGTDNASAIVVRVQ